MRSPTCQRAVIAVCLLLSAAPGCCARLVALPNWQGHLRYAVPPPVWRGESWRVLGKSLVQPLELCWCQAPARCLAVFDRALDPVRFGNGDDIRPRRTPVQGHLG